MYNFKNISKSFGNEKVLNSIALSIPDASIQFLTGKSGTGKTTLLKILAGLEEYVDEKNQTSLIVETTIAYVPQSNSLWSNLTVQDNIILYRKLFLKEPDAVSLKICEWLFEILKISNKLHRYPSKLSAGEQQRVAIARALASEKKLILLDETTANLDFENKEILQEVIIKAIALGKSFLFVSHDLHFISLFSDSCLVLENTNIKKKEISVYAQNRKFK